MTDICKTVKPAYSFSHYAYGDPMPIWARYYASNGETVEKKDAAVLYVRCQREDDHEGMHMAIGQEPWE